MSGSSTCACAMAKRLGIAKAGPDTCAIIVAGGSGERFGDPRGKQFVELCGLPIMAWSILAFDRSPSVGHLVVVCPHGRLDEVRRDVLASLTLRCDVTLTLAGATRQDSVFSGLVAMPPDFDLVAIHDGARPLVEPAAPRARPTRSSWSMPRERSLPLPTALTIGARRLLRSLGLARLLPLTRRPFGMTLWVPTTHRWLSIEAARSAWWRPRATTSRLPCQRTWPLPRPRWRVVLSTGSRAPVPQGWCPPVLMNR